MRKKDYDEGIGGEVRNKNINGKLALAMAASIIGPNAIPHGPIRVPFKFDEETLKGFKAFKSFIGAEKGAYMTCKSHPIASKLSANERKRWQRELIEKSEDDKR